MTAIPLEDLAGVRARLEEIERELAARRQAEVLADLVGRRVAWCLEEMMTGRGAKITEAGGLSGGEPVAR